MSDKKLPQGITLRKDGRYMWRFKYAGVNYSGYAHKLPEAKRAMADKRYEVEHGLSGKEQNIIMDAWFPEWISTYKAVECKEITVDRYKGLYDRYIKSEFGKIQLKKIRTDAIQKFLNKMAEQYSKTTVSLVHLLLNGSLRQAKRNGLISKNPMDDVIVPKCRPKKKRAALPDEQERQFLQAAKSCSYLYPLYRLSSLTGLRSGELRGLQWDDIDFDKQIIHVRHTLSYTKDKGFYLSAPKSEASRRDVPMVSEAYKILREVRKKQIGDRILLGEFWRPKDGLDNLVFTNKKGGPVAAEAIKHENVKIIAKAESDGADLEGFSLHVLRHCFATRAIEAGMNPKTLQSILGHSTFSMTMDMYVDAMEDNKREEMKKIAIAL